MSKWKGASPKARSCLLGGKIPEGPGAFYPPTVLAGRKEGHARL